MLAVVGQKGEEEEEEGMAAVVCVCEMTVE